MRLGLNPFFIRSAVGIQPQQRVVTRGSVLIPSSSGLRLEYHAVVFCVETMSWGRGCSISTRLPEQTPGVRDDGVRKIGSRRMAERDSARKTASAKRYWPGRCQQRISTDIVPARIDVFLDVVEHGAYFTSCGDGMKHRVLQWCRMTA